MATLLRTLGCLQALFALIAVVATQVLLGMLFGSVLYGSLLTMPVVVVLGVASGRLLGFCLYQADRLEMSPAMRDWLDYCEQKERKA